MRPLLSIATVIILSITALFCAVLFSCRHKHKTKKPFECGCPPIDVQTEHTPDITPALMFIVADAVIILFLAILILL